MMTYTLFKFYDGAYLVQFQRHGIFDGPAITQVSLNLHTMTSVSSEAFVSFDSDCKLYAAYHSAPGVTVTGAKVEEWLKRRVEKMKQDSTGHEFKGVSYTPGATSGGTVKDYVVPGQGVTVSLTIKPLQSTSTANMADKIRERIPVLETSTQTCPGCVALYEGTKVPPKRASLRHVIIHLNDAHRWTREEIADWLDTLDVDLTL